MQPKIHFALLPLFLSHSLGQPFPLQHTSLLSIQKRSPHDPPPQSHHEGWETDNDVWGSILRGSPLRECRGYLPAANEDTRPPLAIHAVSSPSPPQVARPPCSFQSRETSWHVAPAVRESKKKRKKKYKAEDKAEEGNDSSLQVASSRSRKRNRRSKGKKENWANDPKSKEMYKRAVELFESKEQGGSGFRLSKDEMKYLDVPGVDMFKAIRQQYQSHQHDKTRRTGRKIPRDPTSDHTIDYHLGKLKAVLEGDAKGTTITKSTVEKVLALAKTEDDQKKDDGKQLLELLAKTRDRIFKDWDDDPHTYCVSRRNCPFPLLDEVLKSNLFP
ncbi:hypothetical protein FA10DRAFT_262762 [Acaromyces ingoldii]|uniref:Uncharacterized protein n=1 Tax=Acaromyces ingoldii TaxID=215250 RepID=A0A316YGU6_9BASI|nr:hypothetical protein FA10DRAFT_262762 [Acaromyces ingoldii]PWN86965.1 hypothetical protein FA10DRAFT_262762 [Acaromyces ingoldii]